jgi:dsDNA-binding SOS-regulon protein
MRNLDLECADLGRSLAAIADENRKVRPKELEKLLTDALSVLEEQGLYAFFLFLKVQKEDDGTIFKECADFLRKQSLLDRGEPEPFTALSKLADNLDNLLFARELLRQVLVYARYHLKARRGEAA